MNGIESLADMSLEVQVRSPGGLRLDGVAIVTLCNSSGQTISSKLALGSEAIFAPVYRGSYIVNVEAPGFRSARIATPVSNGKEFVAVTLQPDSSIGASSVSTSPSVALTSKAQKELGKGYEALQANKFDESIKHLEAAQHLAPNHPDVPYLLGTVYGKKQDIPSARRYWDAALAIDPNHISSLLALGDTLLHQEDALGARKYLDKAVEVAPNSWHAHSLLAIALLRQGSYPEAVTHSERAIDLGKEQAESSRLTLGQALAGEHQSEQAITALQLYLSSKPPDSLAKAVRELIARLKNPAETSSASAVSATAIISAVNEVPDITLTPAILSWLPANVADAIPPVEPGVSCSLDDVLKNVAARVEKLPALVDRFTATEILHHEDINSTGYTAREENLSFNYAASIHEIRSKYGNFLSVEEYRNGSPGEEMFPDQMATKGLPSMALIFHPWLSSDFDMKCEGLGRIRGNFAWQVYFRQREDKESRIRRYRISEHKYPIALVGRAWIDASTYQVVKLETDLREPYPDIRLAAEHLAVEYGPVQFKSRKEVLWLPSSAEYYSFFRGHRIHRRHAFSDYLLFSVDEKEKIGELPKPKSSNEQ